jgi:ethanolamine ammonia-lyase small subunit
MTDGIKAFGIETSPPFFVQYGRVGSEDSVTEATGAEVVVCLIGERPGLVTSESMSAYLCYKAYLNIPEAKRTVISNIHRGGTPAVEAGSYIADLVKLMLEKKASGLDLKL